MSDQEMCSNCRREIPAQNYRMHTLHCARNIKLCEDCNEPIPIHELEEHREEEHALKPCSQCGEGIPGSKLQEHQDGVCPKKSIICKYCATHIEQGNQAEHENYCGSRTDKCEECGEFIMLKNFELHINSNHGFIKLDDEPGPKASWEKSAVSQSTGSAAARRSSRDTSSYVSRYSKYSDPEPSTPQQRSNFSATELFNNQDLYSSRRYSSTNSSTAAKATVEKSSNSLISKSSSSSVVSSSLTRSSTNSIVNRSLTQMTGGVLASSKSTSVVSSLMKEEENDGDVEKLPCEFCTAMIPMFKLLSHQAECVNPTNVRENGSSSAYRAYSSLRSNHNDSYLTSSRRDSSATRRESITTGRERSITRSASMATNSLVSKHLENGDSSRTTDKKSNGDATQNGHQSSTYDRKSNGESRLNGSDSVSRKTSSILDRYSTNTTSSGKNDNYFDSSGTTSYLGRSSYLRQENSKPEPAKIKKSASSAVVAGMYENDDDRESLRQMLSGMRRDPMDVEDDPDNNDGSFFPCEFCGDPYPCEFLMRHQMSCDLNPQPVSSGSGFDYSSIKNSIARTVGGNSTNNTSSQQQQQVQQQHQSSSHRLSRSNSTVERTHSRSTRSNSISRTSSFADRSYGTRTNLARKASYTVADYSSAVRRSSVFDGYAGYSIYSSISEGLDQITYGGRSSRRNSVTEMTYSFSRRGSVSGGTTDYPLPALMAALDASKASQEERREKSSRTTDANAHVNGQASAYLSSIHSFSRQNSGNNDSPRGIDSPFGAVNGHHNPIDLQRSDSRAHRLAAIKPSQSGHRLERRVSFHNRDQIIQQDTVDENGMPIDKPDKPKRKKERTEEEKQARREKKERKERKRMERGESKERRSKSEKRAGEIIKNKEHPIGGDLLEQVSAKLQTIERAQSREILSPLPSTSLLPSQASSNHAHLSSSSTTTINNTTSSTCITSNNNNVCESANSNNIKTIRSSTNKMMEPNNNINNISGASSAALDKTYNTEDNLVMNHDNTDTSASAVTLRGEEERGSKMSSKRNSLDNKSVQSLAKDLAAECAKAYELMESSLSKLTNDFSIGPFGLTPKNKKKHRAPPPPTVT